MFNLGGTFRIIEPQKTLEKIQPLLSQVGITRIANVTGLDDIGIATYLAVRPMAKCLSVSQGKGLTHQLAKISALMECIELWHAENLVDAGIHASYNELKINANLCNVNELTAGRIRYSNHKERKLSWLKAVNLIDDTTIYIPRCAVSLDYEKLDNGYEMYMPTSNGLASGNSLDEAISHALFEVIERQCEAQSFKIDLTKRKLNLNSIQSVTIKELFNQFKHANVSVSIWDVTNQLNIPCYQVNISDNSPRSIGNYYGSGCHFSPEVALLRALTEAAQSRLTFISGSRDDLSPLFYAKIQADQQNIMSNHENGQYEMQQSVYIPKNFQTLNNYLCNQLMRNGYQQIIKYDLTQEKLHIPVVKIMVPGMQFDLNFHSTQ